MEADTNIRPVWCPQRIGVAIFGVSFQNYRHVSLHAVCRRHFQQREVQPRGCVANTTETACHNLNMIDDEGFMARVPVAAENCHRLCDVLGGSGGGEGTYVDNTAHELVIVRDHHLFHFIEVDGVLAGEEI